MRKRIVASWSGGIDSTAVIVNLLHEAWEVHAVTLDLYSGRMEQFARREARARDLLIPYLARVARHNGGTFRHTHEADASWIWAFSYDNVEIPRRNKHIIDYLILHYLDPANITNIALGEYTGADTWLVRDHVGAQDADHRWLASYILHEYGLKYRLISLQDFGESRYKHNRLWLLLAPGGVTNENRQIAALTTNCLNDVPIQCGQCYKCIERHAAFLALEEEDQTSYSVKPDPQKLQLYLDQMRGNEVTAPAANFVLGKET